MKRVIVFIAMITMVFTAFAAGNQEESSAGAVDVQNKTVEITGYLLGDAPAGMDLVLEEINEKMLSDINTTVDIKHISWGDFSSKYPLVLAAGDNVDFIFTANWSYYAQESLKGAFYELTEDSIKQYMPRHHALLNSAAYGETLINGKMYMVPTATPDKKIPMAIIRADLRKKYNIPEINNFSDLEPYFAAIKENEPTMYPMFLDSSYDLYQPFTALVSEAGDTYIDVLFSAGSGTGLMFSIEETDSIKLHSIVDGDLMETCKKAAATINDWSKKGYINQDAFSNTVLSKDSFVQGKSALAFTNSVNAQSVIATAAANGWEVDLIPILDTSGHYMADPYINNGVAIAASSKNPERTMMVLDLLMAEPSYNYLAYFGVEGVNYIVNSDGKIDLPSGVTPETNTYPPDASGFWFTNKDQFKPLASWDDQYISLVDRIRNEGMLISSPMATFNPIVENVQAEVSSLNNVLTQYLFPMYIGLVDDIDGAFAELESKLDAAGIDRVQAELQKQIDVFVAQ